MVAPRFPQTPHVYSPSFVSPQRFYDVGWSCVIRSFGCPPPTAMAMGAKEHETRRSPTKRSKRLLILKEHESYETRRSPHRPTGGNDGREETPSAFVISRRIVFLASDGAARLCRFRSASGERTTNFPNFRIYPNCVSQNSFKLVIDNRLH